MKFQRKEIVLAILQTLFRCSFLIVFVVTFLVLISSLDSISELINAPNLGLFIIFLVIPLFLGYRVKEDFSYLIATVSSYKRFKEKNLPSNLCGLDKYSSNEEMRYAFQIQAEQCYFDDGRVVVTQDFLFDRNTYDLFLINGILDIRNIIHKTNGTTDYVCLAFIYSDGQKYKIVYKRPLGISYMEPVIDGMHFVANFVAQTSINFRKYGNLI